MITILSLVTSVKDYVEITHKFIQLEPLKNYTEFGALFSYLIVSIGTALKDFLSFSLNIWSIPIIVPDIASAMISEVSVLDSYFHSAFTFLETNVASSSSESTPILLIFEKFFIGLINSFFLFLPTSTSHLITLRRFVMQGLEAGYLAGLGTIAGNFLWISSVILGWRFFVIPWLSFDVFRYFLGFILLVKYIWDSSKERRTPLEGLSKWKIFGLNFLLALTEQTCLYPFLSNLSFGPDASILEGFASENYTHFLLVHGAYLSGILIGSFSLLQFACWFWENPAFSIYIWITTKASNSSATGTYYKILNFTLLYLTMLCAIASIPYYGLDYTITNPIGLVPQDRILTQKKSQFDSERLIPETAFLGVNPTDKNTRIRDGIHARRERWKQRLIKYQAYDASIYDQGVYDFLTIEDLNYGFDRFWLRRKMRNHQIRFRLFPGPWMRSLKKQLNKPASLNNKEDKAYTAPRVEFFRILFEQFYHPNFHDRSGLISSQKGKTLALSSTTPEDNKQLLGNNATSTMPFASLSSSLAAPRGYPISPLLASARSGGAFASLNILKSKQVKPGLIYKHSALRKFVRNFNTRTNLKYINQTHNNGSKINETQKNRLFNQPEHSLGTIKFNTESGLYSKRWKSLLAKTRPYTKTTNFSAYLLFRNLSKQILKSESLIPTTGRRSSEVSNKSLLSLSPRNSNSTLKLKSIQIIGSPNIPRIVSNNSNTKLESSDNLKGGQSTNAALDIREYEAGTLLRPLAFYLQKDQAFKRKLRYYGSTPMRKLIVGNQGPYLKTLMKRSFYYYKPSLRLKKTLYVASMRRGFRKKSRKQRILMDDKLTLNSDNNQINSNVLGDTPAVGAPKTKESTTSYKRALLNTGFSTDRASYSILNKRASRYRHQIYKDVLQHWYYTPFNRLALKFDIDAFINRQPKKHFLTKNEESLLHVKRYLLSEHYDSLRWYTYMQHYRTMKTNIGSTKSFASRIYNQQFQGTFKKIRHLFAVTPNTANKDLNYTGARDLSILKFDQPLYNDNNVRDKNLIYLHEELFNEGSGNAAKALYNGKVSPASTLNITGSDSSRLKANNGATGNNALPTSFVVSGDLIDQSQLLILNKINPSSNDLRSALPSAVVAMPITTGGQNIYTELLIQLIKECKRQIYDQTFLKNYISHRIEKREKRNQEQTKELVKRLEKLKSWLMFYNNSNFGGTTTLTNKGLSLAQNYLTTGPAVVVPTTTGMQKALNDSVNVTGDKYAKTKLNLLTRSTIRTNNSSANKSALKGITYLDWWRQKQKAVTKRKTARKRERFKKQIAGVKLKLDKLEKRRFKRETHSLSSNSRLGLKSEISAYLPNLSTIDSTLLRKKDDHNIWQRFLMQRLSKVRSFAKKKSSKGSRYRALTQLPYGRYLSATRKPKMLNLFTTGSTTTPSSQPELSLKLSKFDRISSSNGVFLNKMEKLRSLDSSGFGSSNLETHNNLISKVVAFEKQSYSPVLKNIQVRHNWKKYKRFKFNNSQNKYRKRRVKGRGKARALSKKFKKLKATNELRHWWWNAFLPRYYETLTISPTSLTNQTAFKPLSTQDTIKVGVASSAVGVSTKTGKEFTNSGSIGAPILDSTKINPITSFKGEPPMGNQHRSSHNTSSQEDGYVSDKLKPAPNGVSNEVGITTNLPFYAGWDESLRKFIVTNRLLTRRDTGSTTTASPLQGLNEGSFLYWQTEMPFNSYNIDQFIATNQSVYAPLGWRRFEFRHSILKSWNKATFNYKDDYNVGTYTAFKRGKIMLDSHHLELFQDQLFVNTKLQKIKYKKALARRVKKRHKLVNKMPSQLIYTPTGPLLIEILPSHYVSIFDQQYRFPRNRYLKRRLLKSTNGVKLQKTTLLTMLDSAYAQKTSVKPVKEFTLRKRVKPRRKYHRKRFIKKDGLIFPRRTKFTFDLEQRTVDTLRWRPVVVDTTTADPNTKQKRNISERAKMQTNKRLKTNPLRLRQLRRRDFQQILKPMQRYQPRNGGFTWPGDYLRLEVVEMPKLQGSAKQKIGAQPVGITPRKYLLEKHNILVLKKKLQKVHHTKNLAQAIKEYKFLTQHNISPLL